MKKNKKNKRYIGNALSNAFLPVLASLGITLGATTATILIRSSGSTGELNKSHEIEVISSPERGYTLTAKNEDGKIIKSAKKDEKVIFEAKAIEINGKSTKPTGIIINETSLYNLDQDTLSVEVTIPFIEKMEVKLWFNDSAEVVAYFHLNDGTGITNEVVVQNYQKIPKPLDPVWLHHKFLGWYSDEQCSEGNEWDFDTRIENDVHLYAKWEDEPEILPHELTLIQPESSIGWSISCNIQPQEGKYFVKKGDSVSFSIYTNGSTKAPTRLIVQYEDDVNTSAYQVSKIDENNFSSTIEIVSAKPLSVWAEFGSAAVYTVSFNSDGGTMTGADTQQIEGGTYATNPGDSTKTGYTFKGWFAPGETSPFDFENTPITSDMTLTAHWDINSYPIQFCDEDGEGLTGWEEPQNLPYKSMPTYEGPTPTKVDPEGKKTYTFIGWNPSVQPVDVNETPENPVKYCAVFAETTSQYKVQFNSNGGTNVESQIKDYGSKLDPVSVERSGYDFINWTTQDGTAWDFDTDTLTKNEILTANWKKHEYTITFKNGDGVETLQESLVEYQTLPVYSGSKTPTKDASEGKIYKWDGTWNPSLVPATSNTIYYPNFTVSAGAFAITFDSKGGTYVPQQFPKWHEKVTEPTTPTKTGYTFGGWYKDETCSEGQEWDFNTEVEADYKLYAKWTPKTVHVEFKNGSETLQESDVNVGDTPTYNGSIPTKSTAEYTWTFKGWDKDLAPVEWSESSIVYNAVFEQGDKQKYAVEFDTQGGTYVDTTYVEYGSTVAEPTQPTRDGYAWNGWHTDPTTSSPFTFTTPITAKTTLYAHWTPLTYTITFKDYDGTILQTLTNQAYNSIPSYSGSTTPSRPKGTGVEYQFAGWKVVGSSTSGYIPTQADNIYEPVFIEIGSKCAVQFVTNGGTAIEPKLYSYGDKIDVTPTWTGHTFDYWCTDSTLKTKWDMSTQQITSSMVLYAKWK